MKQLNEIKLTPCWYVAEWATEIIEGIGANVTVNDGWGNNEKTIFFIKGDSVMYMYYSRLVHFDKGKAFQSLQDEKEKYKNYYIKQKQEAIKKIEELSK